MNNQPKYDSWNLWVLNQNFAIYKESMTDAITEEKNLTFIGKGVHQDCILTPAYLTYMQSTSWEMLDWMKHKQESRLPGECQ